MKRLLFGILMMPALSAISSAHAQDWFNVQPTLIPGPMAVFDEFHSRMIGAPCAGNTRDCSHLSPLAFPNSNPFDTSVPFVEHDVCMQKAGKPFDAVDFSVSECHRRLAQPSSPTHIWATFKALSTATMPDKVSCGDMLAGYGKIGAPRQAWTSAHTANQFGMPEPASNFATFLAQEEHKMTDLRSSFSCSQGSPAPATMAPPKNAMERSSRAGGAVPGGGGGLPR